MRARHVISRVGWVGAISVLLLGLPAGTAFAQQIDITPKTSITPSSHVTTWVFQMAIAAAALGVLILVALALGYLRFAPKFFGREETAQPAPPGTRPATLTRQAAAVRWTPPATAGRGAPTQAAAPAAAPSATVTATAVAERPAPAARPAAESPASGAAAAAAASATPTAGPNGEPAVQADAVGAAEAAAPEPRPTAKTSEEIGAPAQPAPAAAAPAPAPSATAASAPAPPGHGAAATLDQETFDRVLKEQLDKGVDRRVAEGRARAAAVVAARKKSQG